MSDCETIQALLKLHIEGELSDGQLAELKAHTPLCQACREDFERAVRTREMLQDAFLPQTNAEEARAGILSRLNPEAVAQPRPDKMINAWWIWPQRAAAAAALLAVGLLLGFALGRTGSDKVTEPEPSVAVPIAITNLKGTVLVKHQGRQAWHILTADSAVYLGDTFHSTARSGFTLAMDDLSHLELDQNSTLVLQSFDGETQFYLKHGQCRAALESPHPPFVVSTPHGRVEAQGTEFTVNVE